MYELKLVPFVPLPASRITLLFRTGWNKSSLTQLMRLASDTGLRVHSPAVWKHLEAK